MNMRNQLETVERHLAQRKCLWLDCEYAEGDAIYRREFFIKRHGGVLHVGLDEYLDGYEDAIDLYRRYVRASFDTLYEAMDFVLGELGMNESDIVAGCKLG
ncbi:hypothetical protein WH218_05375 [Stenotrophomonas indicatrix]|jgi:hypothetical protein|uniref:hypothetical protein n=1 Tax=Stenotrophomonas indicatrix TaxID=2045451 RepID=UPI0015DDC3CA|nr:hypothetical protein [Stenotrophomonas indicatrix]MBA0098485.1 hypothetical protein [Stenotrophomonas indicatrix]